MGGSLSLECSDAVSCARCAVYPVCPSLGGVGWCWAGCGRLKAPHIALPGYHNDSQELKVLRVTRESLRNFRLSIAVLHHHSGAGFPAQVSAHTPELAR